jgi:glycosyltransferase 2 family protein
MTSKKTLRFALSIFLASLFLYLTLSQISFKEIERAFQGADMTWVIAALAAFAVGYSCRIERWRVMLELGNPTLRWSTCSGPLLASIAANNILPFRAGDVLRSFAFNRKLNTTSGVVIATLLVERLLDFFVIVILLGVALALFGLDNSYFAEIGLKILIASALLILAVLFFPRFFTSVFLQMGQLVSHVAPRFGNKILKEINRCLTTLQHLAKQNIMARLVSWSLMAWFAEGCVFWFAALALPSILAPLAAWIAFPVGTLATLIPSTPGYVGTFDFFTMQAMAALGNVTGAAAAYALLVHALLWLPPTLIGGVYLLQHQIKQPDKLKETSS